MDLIRRPYTTKCRFFRDSDMEVDISWYPCKPGAPCLPVPSAICSLDWWVGDRAIGITDAYAVGEVPGASRKYNGLAPKPHADGKVRCGTDEMFADGAALEDAVGRARNTEGLPVCCGGAPPGVVVGGRAGPPPTQPGVVVGGHAGPVSPPLTAAGGVVVGGHASQQKCCYETFTDLPTLLVSIPDGPRSAGSPFLAVWSNTNFCWFFTDGSGETLRLLCQTGHWFVATMSFEFLADSITFACSPVSVLFGPSLDSTGSVTVSPAP